MEELDDYLNSQASDGDFQGTGNFAVDFSKARHKIGKYTLAKEEDWVIRLMQGFARLGASQLDFKMGRKHLTAVATFDSEAPDLTHLFRLENTEDPRYPLQDAVWGALGKGLRVEVLWGETCYKIDDTIEALDAKWEAQTRVVFRVLPIFERGQLLKMLFGRYDFGREFAEIARVGYLAPYSLSLDGRPYDFESQKRETLQEEDPEVRVEPAFGGLRIKAPAFQQGVVRRLARDEPLDQQVDYRLLMKIGWGLRQMTPLLHWVVDGIRVETHPLRPWKSHLWIELYLPADGFATDLTRLKLVQSQALLEHRRHLERLAVYSLLTVPPICQQNALVPDLVAQQIRRFAAESVRTDGYKRSGKAVFKNEVQQHQNRIAIAQVKHKLQLEQWETEKRMHEEIEETKAAHRSLLQEEARFGALALSGQIDTKIEEWTPKTFDKPKPSIEKVSAFLGEVYLALPRKERKWTAERPHVPQRFQSSGS